MKQYTSIGIVLTAIWVIGSLALLWLKRDTLADLPVNAWGDFFAGAVAPIAFLWLVLGYVQQGEELRINTDALRSQQEELRRQVEETARLVGNAERQAAAAEMLARLTAREVEIAAYNDLVNAQPIFRPAGGTGSGSVIAVNTVNVGAVATNVSVESSGVHEVRIEPSQIIESGQTAIIRFNGISGYPFIFKLTYEDKKGRGSAKAYKMTEPFRFAELNPLKAVRELRGDA